MPIAKEQIRQIISENNIESVADVSPSWPRNTEEVADLTEEQYHYLMLGLNPLDPKIKEVTPRKAG